MDRARALAGDAALPVSVPSLWLSDSESELEQALIDKVHASNSMLLTLNKLNCLFMSLVIDPFRLRLMDGTPGLFIWP